MTRFKFNHLFALWVFGLVLSLGFAAHSEARSVSLDDRVAAQRAIEQVYWAHRVWPKENPAAKPPLSAVMSDEAIRAQSMCGNGSYGFNSAGAERVPAAACL